MEMITIYLKQTPALIQAMKKSLEQQDWDGVKAAAHKIIPSFSIMGISKDFENIAKEIQVYKGTGAEAGIIQGQVSALEEVCTKAYVELEEEYIKLKNTKA